MKIDRFNALQYLHLQQKIEENNKSYKETQDISQDTI